MNPSLSPYQTLEVKSTATQREIAIAYRKLAKRFHPDRNPNNLEAEARFKEISAAYELIGDMDARLRYDASRRPVFEAAPGPDGAAQAADAAAKPYAKRNAISDLISNLGLEAFAWDGAKLRAGLFVAMFLLAMISVFGTALLSWQFWLIFVPIAAGFIFLRFDDATYFITSYSPPQMIFVWLLVMTLSFGTAYSISHDLILSASNDPYAGSHTSLLLAPFRLAFYLYYLFTHSAWAWPLAGLLAAWLAALVLSLDEMPGWIFLSLLIGLTAIARFDTTLMADFVRYYSDLFSIQPGPGPIP